MPEQMVADQEWRQALPANGDRSMWTDQQASLIEAMGLVHVDREGAKTLAPRPVVEAFLYTSRRTGLDPLARQVYCIARWDGASQSLKWTTQTSIDGFRVIAERHGKYAGQGDVEWLTDRGEWVDVFIPSVHGEHPLAARATVYRHDFLHPLRAVAEWGAYVQTKRDGSPNSMWTRMGPGQLAKCAEALALRKGFPQDLSGLYTADEMGQADSESAQPLAIAAGVQEPQVVQEPQQQSTTVQQAPGTRAVDLEEQTSWWETAKAVRHKGVKGSGDGGARDTFERMRMAGVLAWPVGPGDDVTFREYMRDLAAKLPDELPDEREHQNITYREPEEDAPMALAADPQSPGQSHAYVKPSKTPSEAGTAATGPGEPVVVSEPQPPAPPVHRAPDEAEQEVQQWTPPAAEDDGGWAAPDDAETPF